ncbi:MAG TPA: hypothetical protein VHT91_48520 [Kofleriaceae bacterium]|nr:hypothetical protein [Kofleriaceae bacterium]
MVTTRIKRRKATRKEFIVPVRMTAEQKATLVAAAERNGLGVSTWLLTLGLREAANMTGNPGAVNARAPGRR